MGVQSHKQRIIVIGGGAAGLVAAITAARAGAHVYIVEKNDRLGKKILETGNGRCNLSNVSINREQGFLVYHNSEFATPTLEQYGCNEVREFFFELGLLTTVDEKGWVFPYTKRAHSVLDVLLQAVRRLNIECLLGVAAERVKFLGERQFQIRLSDGATLEASSVIVATGVSTVLDELAAQAVVQASPVLASFPTETGPLKGLDGVRCAARLALYRDKQLVHAESGEVLFRTYGVSGIAAFNLSRHIQPSDNLVLDLMPSYELAALMELLEQRRVRLSSCHFSSCSHKQESTHAANGAAKEDHPYKAAEENTQAITAQDFLVGMVHNRIAQALLWQAGIDLDALVTSQTVELLAQQLKAFTMRITGHPQKQQAQVMRGGLVVEGFEPSTLQSRLYSGLFAVGEALDVDGPCGGYNLHWAWASGLVAGAHVGGQVGAHVRTQARTQASAYARTHANTQASAYASRTSLFS